MSSTSDYIEEHKKYWGSEFATILQIDYKPEHVEIAAMGGYTMLYAIADDFQDGKFREEILKQFGVKK
jgi:hypothetical protein